MRVFAPLRSACAELVREARFVSIETTGLRRLAEQACSLWEPPRWDASTHFCGDDASLLAYVITLDTLNFGSGWFPRLRKRPGRSGYFVLSLGLKEAFEREGPFSAARLAVFDAPAVAVLLEQERDDPELAEFFELAAKALRDLATLLEGSFGGSFVAMRRSASDSAEDFVALLTRMPLFRDIAHSATGLEIPFCKRAQITVSDLALAFGDRSYGHFSDLDRLTAFADNTLPHVLRCEQVLEYAPGLAARIEAGQELANGSPEEIEIRAAAVHSVELMCRHLSQRGDIIAPREMDAWLWTRGQDPAYKKRPRHRTRCTFY